MMASKVPFAVAAIALLCGCGARQDASDANGVVASAETRNTAASATEQLSRDQALGVMKQRHEHMETLGKATKKAHNALESSPPDLATIRDSAASIDALAPKLVSWFPGGTGPDVGKTRAKAEIWQKSEDFALKAQDFERAANEFHVAAKRGHASDIETTFAAMGKTCKACHDLYRAPEKH